MFYPYLNIFEQPWVQLKEKNSKIVFLQVVCISSLINKANNESENDDTVSEGIIWEFTIL